MSNIPTICAKAIIRDGQGSILLLKGKSGIWDLPGGLVEIGETREKALIRELREELNTEARIVGMGGTWSFHRTLDGRRVEVQNYFCEIAKGSFALSHEHIEWEWVPRSELRNYPVKDESFYGAIG